MKHLSCTHVRHLTEPITASNFAGRVADHDPSAVRLDPSAATSFAG